MAKVEYSRCADHSVFFTGLMGLHILVVAVGLGAALYMEHYGHVVTGMSNQIVWGTPHVFAVFLIVAASGALNVASFSSVFNRLAYKPYARLSGLLAIALLAGGLAVLVLDLGRPDRLIVAMTTYNFKSIFAWNIYLYTGFFAVVAAYLFVMMDRKVSRSHLATKAVGGFAFFWRFALTTGTGSIFGFLIARDAYSAAIMAPLFIASSFLYGLAFTVLVLLMMSREVRGELIDREMLHKFRGLFDPLRAGRPLFHRRSAPDEALSAELSPRGSLPAARRRHLHRRVLDRANRRRHPASAALLVYRWPAAGTHGWRLAVSGCSS